MRSSHSPLFLQNFIKHVNQICKTEELLGRIEGEIKVKGYSIVSSKELLRFLEIKSYTYLKDIIHFLRLRGFRAEKISKRLWLITRRE